MTYRQNARAPTLPGLRVSLEHIRKKLLRRLVRLSLCGVALNVAWTASGLLGFLRYPACDVLLIGGLLFLATFTAGTMLMESYVHRLIGRRFEQQVWRTWGRKRPMPKFAKKLLRPHRATFLEMTALKTWRKRPSWMR